VIGEIIGLDDLGRALIATHKAEEREPDLVQVAGEIEAPDGSPALEKDTKR
jgi:hypothetical protein